MTRIADQRTIVGIDPSSRGLAFVFFENGMLLDWGTRRRDGEELALLDEVLDGCKAEVLVLEDAEAPRSERRPRMRRLLRLMRKRASERRVAVVVVSRYDVRRQWSARGMGTKHAVAASFAVMFPELEPLVPRKRKVYRSEEARVHIFDALSLVVYAFSVHSEADVRAA